MKEINNDAEKEKRAKKKDKAGLKENRSRDVQNLEVLDLAEVAGQDGIEVDSNKTLLSKFGLLTHEKILVELVLGVFLYSAFPLVNLSGVVLIKILTQRVEKLDDIFVLFAVL